MRIRLSDPGVVPDLRQHFERSGWVTEQVADDLVEVSRRAMADQAREARAIESHVAVWRAMEPETDVEVLTECAR